MSKTFYISTAIPYVNAKPHIGFALELVQTDAVARYQRLQGKEVFFLSGTDENSLKNVQAAEKADKPVKEYVDEYYKYFYNLKDTLNISFDDFIRTTEERHFKGAQKLWSSFKPEDVYKKKYKGLYCVGCEAFYKEEELIDGKCPEHKTAPEVVEEENWFFKLSNYQEKLRKLIKNDTIKIIPETKKNEWLAFIDRGLEDFSISRSVQRAHGWGVPVPGDETQIMYVWVDALSNYITALDYEHEGENFKKFWQKAEERLHVIGKGIGKFHVLYWPAMLLSAGVDLPTQEFIHGYLTVEGEKISKSLGNVIDPEEVVEKYSSASSPRVGTDAVRYYLLGAVSAYQDGDFSIARFEEFYTAHLVNGVGNLTSRILTMLEKYSNNKIPEKVNDIFDTHNFWKDYSVAFRNYEFDAVVALINELVGECDQKITLETPWAKAKVGEDISVLLYQLAECLRIIAVALLPIIPGTAEKILKQLGTEEKARNWGGLKKGDIIKRGEILFPRLN